MMITSGLVSSDKRRPVTLRSNIAESLAETAVAKLGSTSKKLNRIVAAERGHASLHRPIMLVA
jgi:hypothetical protein